MYWFGKPMTFGENESYADAALRLRERVNAMWLDIDRAVRDEKRRANEAEPRTANSE